MSPSSTHTSPRAQLLCTSLRCRISLTVVLYASMFCIVWGVRQYQIFTHYQEGKQALARGVWDQARMELRQAVTYQDARTLLKESYYRPTLNAIHVQDWSTAAANILALEGLDLTPDYRDVPHLLHLYPPLAAAVAHQRAIAWHHGTVHQVAAIDVNDFVNSVALHPDGQRLAVGTGARVGTTQLWAFPTMTQSSVVSRGRPVFSVTFSPDGAWLAATSGNAEPPLITLWHVQDQHQQSTIEAANGQFSPDSQTLAGVDRQGRVGVWAVPSGQLLFSFVDGTSRAQRVAWSPNGHLIAATYDDGTIRLWSMDEQRPRVILDEPHKVEFYQYGAIAWSPDGRRLATSITSTTTKVWRSRDGQLIHALTHRGPVQSIAWSPNQQLLAVGTDNLIPQGTKPAGYIMLWRIEDGQLVQLLDGQKGNVTSVLWSLDGRTLLSGSHDRTIRFWRP